MSIIVDAYAWLTAAERWSGANGIPARTLEHIELTVVAMVIALVIAVPPALYLAHRRRGEFLASAVVNLGRAIPSFGIVVLAALLFLTWGFGVSFWAIIVALVALALPPIFTNTYAGVRSVDANTVEAARGMGLTEREVLLDVELPMAAPIILAGIRIALVQVIATVPLGAIVGPGGGLGRYVVDGFALGPTGYARVFGGAILIAVLTLLAERAFTLGERAALPSGVQRLVRTEDVAETAPAA
ncbi:MAG: ABC transporter permease [Nitriliruptorales bacterium]|nr:ABC transporter permease [Nitriliruptorales bacterium]